jgi:hypothetical protein
VASRLTSLKPRESRAEVVRLPAREDTWAPHSIPNHAKAA